MTTLPVPLDFAATWHHYMRHNMKHRLQDVDERAFWAQNAAGYNAGVRVQPEAHQQTLAAIHARVQPGDTLLDVGAGSGRFALPLAAHVHQVTALDLSPDMLALLAQKARQQGVSNIQTIEGSWEHTPVAPHDVVLAAWSFYRQPDTLAGLQKLVDATRRTLIIVDGDYAARPDDDPPHERLRAEIWGAGDPGICNYLYFAGMLRQIRVRAEIQVVYEHYRQTAADALALAQALAPSGAEPESVREYASRLSPYLRLSSNGGVEYDCQFTVGLVTWQRR